MTLRPCPECHGARLRPESLAVQGRRAGDPRVHADVGQAGDRVARAARAVGHRAPDRPADPARDRRAAALPRQRRGRLPLAGAGGGHALGRRGPADPAGHPDRVVAGGRALHPRRALDRPAPARQRAPDRHARAATRPRQHGDRRRARRGHDARPPTTWSTSARAPASTAASWWPRAPPSDGDGASQESLTGQYLSGKREIPMPRKRRRPSGYIQVEGAAQHNLQRHRRQGAAGRVLLRSPACRARASRRWSTRCSSRRWPTGCTGPSSARARTGASAGSTRSTRSSTSTSRRSAARRGPTRPPTSGCSTTSASSTRGPRRRGRAATSRAASRSTSRAAAARSAAATARSRSRCTSCPTCTCPASSATASATTARRSRSASRARRSPTCST